VQFHHRANDKTYNLAVIERFALEAAAAGVKILALTDVHKLYERRSRVVLKNRAS
jgi:predicted amidohydrolase